MTLHGCFTCDNHDCIGLVERLELIRMSTRCGKSSAIVLIRDAIAGAIYCLSNNLLGDIHTSMVICVNFFSFAKLWYDFYVVNKV